RPRGTIVLKSTYAEVPRINLASLVVNEVSVVGSLCGPFEPALRLLAEGRVKPAALVSARYPLSEAVEAFERATGAGTLKVLLAPEGKKGQAP
ncbi:MAG: alcohol dehydrogenase, partial [Calditrichaeota bacterium]|nr:alcohol dehydrogenase [Calditrichota bacterium]